MTEPSRLEQVESTLKQSIGKHFPHCQLLSAFLVALMATTRANLVGLAEAMPGGAKEESNRRRLLYFLKHALLPREAFARSVAALIPTAHPWVLAIDRTDWKLGKASINLLVLSVCFAGVGFPLLWMALPEGASSQKHREALMDRFLSLFGKDAIKILIGDREFIGHHWFNYLHDANIPFLFRVRKDHLLYQKDGTRFLSQLLVTRKTHCRKRALLLWDVPVFVGGKPGKQGPNLSKKAKDDLILVSNVPMDLLACYRLRWSIECLFQSLKGRGFQMEDTRLTHPDRLCRLLGLLALAFAWCFLTGQWLHEQRATKVKKHGRKAISLFKRGLRRLRRVLLPLSGHCDPEEFQQVLDRLATA